MVDTSPGTESGRLRFEMRQLLGAGSFGEVYLAMMSSAGGIRQEVAVKVLNRDLDPRSQPVERLRDEGRILGTLNHPVILQVRDLVVLQERVALVTEYVQGADLADVIHVSHTLEPKVALQVIGNVADALDTAFHARASDGQPLRLVHRDIKPANIRLTPHGTVKLLDFGIAKAQEPDRESATSHLVLMGSVPYMAPEVLHMDVEEAGMPRDVYALGCTLFECVTGSLFSGGLKHGDLRRETARPDRYYAFRQARLDTLPPTLSEPLRKLIGRMLAYAARERPSAREVADLAHEIAEALPGPSLRSWAKGFHWPTEEGEQGAWTGKRVSETTIITNADGERELSDEPSAVIARTPTGPARPPTAEGSTEVLPRRSRMLPLALLLLGGAAAVAAFAFFGAEPAPEAVAPPPVVAEKAAPAPKPAAPVVVSAPPPQPVAAPVAPEPAPVPASAAPPASSPPRPAPATPQATASTRPSPRSTPSTAPPRAAPAVPAAQGTLLVEAKGGSLPTALRGAGGASAPGKVAPGTWDVWVDFGEGLVQTTTVTVGAGETVTVFCNRTLQSCSRR